MKKEKERIFFLEKAITHFLNNGIYEKTFIAYVNNGNLGEYYNSYAEICYNKRLCLDDDYLSFIDKSERFLNLFLNFLSKKNYEASNNFNLTAVADYELERDFYLCFLILTINLSKEVGVDLLIFMFFDSFFNNDLKRRFLAGELKNFIEQSLKINTQSKWFFEKDVKERRRALEDYAIKHIPSVTLQSGNDGIFTFFDVLNRIEKKVVVDFHFGKIKALYNNRKNRNDSAKKQVNLQLSPKANREIERMSLLFKVNKSEVIENLLLSVKKSGAEKYLLENIFFPREQAIAALRKEALQEVEDEPLPSLITTHALEPSIVHLDGDRNNGETQT